MGRFTKTSYFVLFALFAAAGVGVAFAIGTITLSGDVNITGNADVDGDLNVDGTITGGGIESRLLAIETALSVVPEQCDAVDNNINNQIDEGFPLGDSCTVGLGICQRSGELVCNTSKDGTICSVTPASPETEICGDSLDSNCNGSTTDPPMFGTCVSQCPLGFCTSFCSNFETPTPCSSSSQCVNLSGCVAP